MQLRWTLLQRRLLHSISCHHEAAGTRVGAVWVGDYEEALNYFEKSLRIQKDIKFKGLELETTIAQAEIIDVSKLSGKEIMFGATVTIEDNKTGEQSTYQIVGEYESNIENKKLSINSPMARGLIGKSKNDVVEINSPKGIKLYTVISVKFQ